MKPTDLMIGDWVLINNTPHKIQAIDSIDAEIQADDELYYVGEDRYHSEDKVKGLPLTAEILEKNGCAMVDKGDYGEWHIKENPNIPLWQHTEFIIFDGVVINYVHELQHALRLCGLDELADNFKV